jgi:hypothetical protein
MVQAKKDLSIADLAAWGSALVTFGLVQGALYLQAYWARFGLNPFQFVAVADLALAGLAGIGIVLGLLLLAMLLGSWLEEKISNIPSKQKLLSKFAPLALLLCLGAIIWWADGWVVLAGAVFSVVCLVIVKLSPVVPSAVKNSQWLIYIVLMLVYVSITSSWLGAESAQKIARGEGKYLSNIETDEGRLEGFYFLGRLGDTYVVWDLDRQATIVVPGSGVRKLDLVRSRAKLPPEVR